jgi:MFS family permease
VISARFGEAQILPVAMFFGSFAWLFVYISLPFHTQRISTWDAAATLQWTGWILGITPLATVATAPLWGRWAERGSRSSARPPRARWWSCSAAGSCSASPAPPPRSRS